MKIIRSKTHAWQTCLSVAAGIAADHGNNQAVKICAKAFSLSANEQLQIADILRQQAMINAMGF
jgi:hypothetical protein